MMKKKAYLGIDVGSISTNVVLMDEDKKLVHDLYIRTNGAPIKAVQEGFRMMREWLSENGGDGEDGYEIDGVGATGSARKLVGVITGADIVKNEITAHAVGAINEEPRVRTVLEIGGQDSKIIIIRDGVVVDFAMNSVCAAGTGSFLDSQASRLRVPIEEFGEKALKSTADVNIAGRCTVFAESDMIHKQQTGHADRDIINGLCVALVRNYLNNVGKGKEILAPIVFQGGVSENVGIKRAFEEALGEKVAVPRHNKVMGALGSALLAREEMEYRRADDPGAATAFKGFEVADRELKSTSFECGDCANHCEVIETWEDGKVISRWGDRCGKYAMLEGVFESMDPKLRAKAGAGLKARAGDAAGQKQAARDAIEAEERVKEEA